jgi:hypothetical protein
MAYRQEAMRTLAMGVTENIATKWQYFPTGNLFVDDRDTNSTVGELIHNNALYLTGAAVKIRDWVFVLERLVTSDRWHLSAFTGQTHWQFGLQKSDDPQQMLHTIVTRFWPVLHSDCFDHLDLSRFATESRSDKTYQISWTIEPLST